MANDFIGKVAAAALADFDGVASFLGLPGGKNQGREYQPLNPLRSDHKPGSFTINRDSGAWSDFATNDKGGDLVALAAYVLGCRQIEAAERLADHLGIARPNRQNQRQTNGDETSKGTLPNQQINAPQAKPESLAVCLMPVPLNAPVPPAAHSRHGRPVGRWAYTDAAGVVCFYHDRYEPKGERKQFSPLTLWRLPDGRMQWQFKAPPAPRPLLGLPDLAIKFGPAVIVEGEKARDAAVLLFPENPVLTWQGGAQAVSKADWQPLAGREVWIWPDNDAAGSKAARDVAAILTTIKAGPVKVFDLASFGRRVIEADGLAALGDADPMAEGDDAADLVARAWTAAHLALILALPEALQAVEIPAPALTSKAEAAESEAPKTGRFQLDAKGVWLIETDRAPRWICSPLEPVAMIRDPKITAGVCWWSFSTRIKPCTASLCRWPCFAAMVRRLPGCSWIKACELPPAPNRIWWSICKPPAPRNAPALRIGPAGTTPAPRARFLSCLMVLLVRMPASGFMRAKPARSIRSPCGTSCGCGNLKLPTFAAAIADCCLPCPWPSLRPCYT